MQYQLGTWCHGERSTNCTWPSGELSGGFGTPLAGSPLPLGPRLEDAAPRGSRSGVEGSPPAAWWPVGGNGCSTEERDDPLHITFSLNRFAH